MNYSIGIIHIHVTQILHMLIYLSSYFHMHASTFTHDECMHYPKRQYIHTHSFHMNIYYIKFIFSMLATFWEISEPIADGCHDITTAPIRPKRKTLMHT